MAANSSRRVRGAEVPRLAEGGTLVSDLEDRARNRLLKLAGHFAHPVRVDAVEEIGPSVYLLKIRDSSGRPDETQITGDELEHASQSKDPSRR